MTISLIWCITDRSPCGAGLNYCFHTEPIWNEMKKYIVDKSMQSTGMPQQLDIDTKIFILPLTDTFLSKQITETPMEELGLKCLQRRA